jgi:hypothetical protein
MREAIPPLPNTSSWRGASLSTGTNLTLPLSRDDDDDDIPSFKIKFFSYISYMLCRI